MQTFERIQASKRVVVKVGSSSITGSTESNLDFLVRLQKLGKDVVLVSSGAIATAMPIIGLTVRSEDLATSQALASIGQAKLMGRYERSLARYDLLPGQMLLTVDNLDQESTGENAMRALERLLEIGVIPIINENDSVATQEIRFGDNDQLAARVALLAAADLLILFSDIDALYTNRAGSAANCRCNFWAGPERARSFRNLNWLRYRRRANQASCSSTRYGGGSRGNSDQHGKHRCD